MNQFNLDLVSATVHQICLKGTNSKLHMTAQKSLLLSIGLLLLLAPFQLLAQSAKIHVSAPSKSLTWFPAHLSRERGSIALKDWTLILS
jgi:hypothetical protein